MIYLFRGIVFGEIPQKIGGIRQEVVSDRVTVLNSQNNPNFDIIPEIVSIKIEKVDQNLFIKNYLRDEAIKNKIDPEIVLWIVKKESNFRPDAVGDNSHSRGLWQINKPANPEVSDKCAFDIICSTKWSLNQIALGNARKWSVYRFCNQWFLDCPFKSLVSK